MARRDTADGAAVEALAGILRGESVLGLSEAQLLERFVARRDGPAFAALMARYGPLVMGVCRRGLDDESEAEDAFQATFLVLVRRAGDIRHADRLGPWLFAVARKVTARARQQARARKPSPAEPDTLADPSPGVEAPAERSELKAIVDGEVAALPDTLRRPVVLCYLDGLTHDEAALRLRWPVGTVRSRLARARSVLKTRLARRGVVAGASALAVELAPSPVSASLIERTVRACLAFTASPFATKAAGTATASLLASGVLRTMLLSKWITLTTAALTLGGTATISSLLIAAGPQGGVDGANAAATTPAESQVIPIPVPSENRREASSRVRQALMKNVESADREMSFKEFLRWFQDSTKSETFPNGVGIVPDPIAMSQAKVTPSTKVGPIRVGSPLNQNLGLALRNIGLSYVVTNGVVHVTSPSVAAEHRFRELEDRLEDLSRDLEERGDKVKADSPPSGPAKAPSATTDRYREINARILEALSKPADLNASGPLTLESLVQRVRKATRSETFPEGIPIELDLNGLVESGATPATEIALRASGVALGPQISMAIRPLGLKTSIHNGALWLTTPSGLAEKQMEILQQQVQLLADAPGKQRAAETPRVQTKSVKNPEKPAAKPASTGRESGPTVETIGDVLYIISPDGRKIAARDAKTGATSAVTIGKPGQDPPLSTSLMSLSNGRIKGFHIEGKKIDSLVATYDGKLVVYPLPRPFDGVAAIDRLNEGQGVGLRGGVSAGDIVLYRLDRQLHVGMLRYDMESRSMKVVWATHDLPESLGEYRKAELLVVERPTAPGDPRGEFVLHPTLRFHCQKGMLEFDFNENRWTVLDFDAILKGAK